MAKKVVILAKYLDFAAIFSKKSAAKLLKRSNINKYAIDLEPSKQLFYVPIYSLRLVKLNSLKTYIKINLVNSFICLFKSPAKAPILFVNKLYNNFRLDVDYEGLNNLTIKNKYPLLLIGKLFDHLRQDKQFTQLDLMSAYYSMRIKKDDK